MGLSLQTTQASTCILGGCGAWGDIPQVLGGPRDGWDPVRVYQTLPGGCQAKGGDVEPVCCHLTSLIMPHTHTHILHPSQPVLPQDMGRRRSRCLPKGVVGLGVPRRAPELPACIFRPLQSSPQSGPEWLLWHQPSAFPQQKGEARV